jgi:hypothetical protein
VLGPITVALGYALFMVPSIGGSYWTTFFPAVVVLGLGMAASVAPLTTTVMNSVSEEHAGTASGINNAVSRIAGVLSIAVFGIVMLSSFDRQLSSRLTSMNLEPETRQKIESQHVKLVAIEIPEHVSIGARDKIRESIAESFVTGFRFVMVMALGLSILSAVTAWLMIR